MLIIRGGFNMQKRSSFSGKLGFVLAAAGSAVGLGNIWRFPYLAAKYGGGTFLFIYLILAVTFGFTLMTAEIAIGRKTGLSAIGAFTTLDKRFKFLGILASAVPIIIFRIIPLSVDGLSNTFSYLSLVPVTQQRATVILQISLAEHSNRSDGFSCLLQLQQLSLVLV